MRETCAARPMTGTRRPKPDLSLAYVKGTLPTKRPGGLEPYLEGLREAGLPE